MWGNLKKLDQINVRHTMQRVAQAVAPVESDDDEYDSEGSYSEEEESAELAQQQDQQRSRSPLGGIVGLLTRAMDQEQEVYNESHGSGLHHPHHEHEEEEIDFPSSDRRESEVDYSSQQKSQQEHAYGGGGTARTVFREEQKPPAPPPSPMEEEEDEASLGEENLLSPTPPAAAVPSSPAGADNRWKEELHDSSSRLPTVPHDPSSEQQIRLERKLSGDDVADEPPPKHLSLKREAGTVTPKTPIERKTLNRLHHVDLPAVPSSESPVAAAPPPEPQEEQGVANKPANKTLPSAILEESSSLLAAVPAAKKEAATVIDPLLGDSSKAFSEAALAAAGPLSDSYKPAQAPNQHKERSRRPSVKEAEKSTAKQQKSLSSVPSPAIEQNEPLISSKPKAATAKTPPQKFELPTPPPQQQEVNHRPSPATPVTNADAVVNHKDDAPERPRRKSSVQETKRPREAAAAATAKAATTVTTTATTTRRSPQEAPVVPPLPEPQSPISSSQVRQQPEPAAEMNGDQPHEPLEHRCRELQQQLKQAQQQILELQQELAQQIEREQASRQEQLIAFQEKEARLLEATQEDHDQELQEFRSEMQATVQMMQQEMNQERQEFQTEHDEMERLLKQAEARVQTAERDKGHAMNQQQKDAAQQLKRQERALHKAEDKLAQTLAVLEDRDDQVTQLKKKIKGLESSMAEHHEGAEEAEEELDELHAENETLRHHLEKAEAHNNELKGRVAQLETDSEQLSSLKLELTMLKEEKEREISKRETKTAAAESNIDQLGQERDAALAQVGDLQQQLAASLADVQVARSDTDRVMTANSNLQAALEAFQSEREAELAMIDDQRREAEEATAAAHAAAIEATVEANEARVRDIELAADDKVRQTNEHVKALEEKLEQYRSENGQMRRSLDEAISRLQMNQDDIIDRTLMKNILLDWLSKDHQKEKQQVLEVMASVLHFTEEEKHSVHIDETGHIVPLGSVVGAIAKPPPPPKADMEHLEGENVRDKWVNFLMAETDD